MGFTMWAYITKYNYKARVNEGIVVQLAFDLQKCCTSFTALYSCTTLKVAQLAFALQKLYTSYAALCRCRGRSINIKTAIASDTILMLFHYSILALPSPKTNCYMSVQGVQSISNK